MNYFNVLPPDTSEALFVGQDGSGHFEAVDSTHLDSKNRCPHLKG
jgi:hypothetical protein